MKRLLLLLLACAIIAVIAWSAVEDKTEPAGDVARTSTPNPAASPVPANSPPEQPPAPALERTEVPPAGRAAEPATPAADATESAVTGRLVFADGSPVRDSTCTGWIQRGHEYRYLQMTTDGNGQFSLTLPADFDGPGRVLAVRSKVDSHVDSPWTRAEVGLAGAYPVGVTDLGDITAAELPLLVSGSVRDTAGHGVGRAAVYAMPKRLVITDMRNRRLPEMFRCDTDAGARFRIFGAPGDLLEEARGPFIVVVKHPNMHQVVIPTFDAGEEDVVVVMAAAGSISGSVATTPNFDLQHVFVELSGDPVEGHMGCMETPVESTVRPLPAGRDLRVDLDELGRFHADLLRPGLLSCSVRLRGRPTPLLMVKDVRIQAGQATIDPRLQHVDLSGLHTVVVRFTDANTGAAVGSIPVGIRESGEPSWNRRVVAQDGTLVVTTPTGSFDVLAQQRGYRRTLLENVTANRTIDLLEGIEVKARVKLGPSLPLRFETSLRLVGEESETHQGFEDVRVPRSAPVIVTDGAIVTLTVPAAGRYRPRVRVQSKDRPREERVDVVGVTPEVMVVPKIGIPSPVMIRLESQAALGASIVLETFFPKRAPKAPK